MDLPLSVPKMLKIVFNLTWMDSEGDPHSDLTFPSNGGWGWGYIKEEEEDKFSIMYHLLLWNIKALCGPPHYLSC